MKSDVGANPGILMSFIWKNRMYADIWPDRIVIHADILEPNSLRQEEWAPLLTDLKAEHVPSFTPVGERIAVTAGLDHRVDVTVYRTAPMSDEEITAILAKYRIRPNVRSEESSPA
ncbi:MAG: hypothetical protein ABSF45_29940 [Terriglobia bacterium]|jgi:hypothetical protein